MQSQWLQLSTIPWSKRRKHQTVIFNDKLLILGGFDGENSINLNDVWSWDGTTWNLLVNHAKWSGRDGHTAVVFNDYIYLLGGTDDPMFCKNDIWRSSDGTNWDIILNNSPWH
jgi:N-acetylneuraminic acid mutarotase